MREFFSRVFEGRASRRRRRPNGLGLIEGLEDRQLPSATLGSLAVDTGAIAGEIMTVDRHSAIMLPGSENSEAAGPTVPALVRSMEPGSVDTFVNNIAAPGQGGGPHLKAIGHNRMPAAPAPSFVGGIRVAVGDVNADGHAGVVAAPAPGTIRVFIPTAEPVFVGGVRVAVGDVNIDGLSAVRVATPPGLHIAFDPFDPTALVQELATARR